MISRGASCILEGRDGVSNDLETDKGRRDFGAQKRQGKINPFIFQFACCSSKYYLVSDHKKVVVKSYDNSCTRNNDKNNLQRT